MIKKKHKVYSNYIYINVNNLSKKGIGINVTHAIYSEKRKYEKNFVINIYEKLNLCGY